MWGRGPEPASRRGRKGPPGQTARGQQAAASLLEVGPLPVQEPPGLGAPRTWQGLPERLLTWFELRLEMRQEHLDYEWVVRAMTRGQTQTLEDGPCQP